MVLLTSDSRSLERCLSDLSLSWRKECRVKVLGVWAAIYVVDKAPARRGQMGGRR
jgi:hypothetical protein